MRGEWIEIPTRPWPSREKERLSPCGESGLKWFGRQVGNLIPQSLPMRGEWIEINYWITWGRNNEQVSPHAGRVD